MMYRSNLDWECDFMVKNKYLGQSLFQRGGYKGDDVKCADSKNAFISS